MLNNFIYAQSKAMFEERIAEVPNEAIVFIEDTKEIWNHGHYFAGEGVNVDDFNNLQTEVSQLSTDKQDQLISGTNIKTINGESILGSGDIEIGGGSSDAYNVVTIEDFYWTIGSTYGPLLPNTKYICLNPLTGLYFMDDILEDDSWHGGVTDIYNEYTIIFESDDCSISLPDYVLWANGVEPIIENGVRYELSISLMYINNEYIAHAILTPFKPV